MTSTETKVALITGAYKGLGFETARQLGQQGVTVVVTARDREKAENAANSLKAEGFDAYGLMLDVTDSSHYGDVVRFLEDRFGRLDILVNNAGIMLGNGFQVNDTLETSEATLRKTFDSNFFGLIDLTAAVLPLIRKSPAGRIVNLSSILGSLTLQSDPNSPIHAAKSFAYNASKSALNAYTIHLADALKDTKIKVNSAHPGWVKTDMGTSAATMELPDGAKTEVELALLGEDGITGGYVHMGKTLPW